MRKIIFVCFLINSCSINRNESGQVRIKESIYENCKNKEVYNVIDTTSLYMKIKVNDKTRAFVGTNDSVNVTDLNIYLKFYSEGKVAMFHGLEKTDNYTLNPKNAIMGFYCLNNNENKMKFVFNHVQSGVFISNNLFEIRNDTILTYTKKSALGGGTVDTYIKKPLSKEFLIYKPDW